MRKSILILTLLALCLPMAKAQTVTVNDGTTTSNFVPFWGAQAKAKFTKSQCIIPASDLTNIGNGCEITGLTYYASANASATFGDATWDVFLAEVGSTTTLSSYMDWTNLTNVYSGAMTVSNGTMTVTFDDSYTYTGENLLIGFKETVKGTNSAVSWYGVTATKGASVATASTKDCSQYSFLPKITFTYASAASCVRPNAPTASDITDESAIISWTPIDETQSNFAVAYGTGNDPDQMPNVPTNGTTAVTITGLAANTTYNIYVKAVCDENNESEWSLPGSFDTELCAEADKCELTFSLSDSWGDGWNGNAIKVVDANSHEELASMTIETGNSYNETLAICDGREISLVWVKGSSSSECSFSVNYADGYQVYSLAQGIGADAGTLFTFAVDCSSCHTPLGLNASNITPSSAYISWLRGSTTAWELKYTDNSTSATTNVGTITSSNYSLNGLTSNTNYTVELRALCNDNETSDWTEVNFTTPDCTGPSALYVYNISKNEATLYWTSGTASEYEVKYTNNTTHVTTTLAEFVEGNSCNITGLTANTNYTVAVRGFCSDAEQSAWTEEDFTTSAISTSGSETVFMEDFEDATVNIWDGAPALPHTWSRINHPDNPEINWVSLYNNAQNPTLAHSGSWQAVNYGYHGPVYLISPPLTLEGSSATLSFWSYNAYPQYYGTPEDQGRNSVLISTGGYSASDFTNEIWSPASVTDEWVETTINIPNQYLNQPIYIAFLYEGVLAHAWFLDDISIDVTTNVPNIFTQVTQNGNWNETANWSKGHVPTVDEYVVIQADATIPTGCIATADQVVLDNGGSITIADGGQLIHNNDGLAVTLQKSVTAYTVDNDNFHFVASPVVDALKPTTAGMTSNLFDLYAFNQQDTGNEWNNYKAEAFNIKGYNGYLYANNTATILSFTGAVKGSLKSVKMTVYRDGDNYNPAAPSYALVGNPFACNATVNCPFYVLNATRDGLVEGSGPIAPGEAVFVEATPDSKSVTFMRVNP